MILGFGFIASWILPDRDAGNVRAFGSVGAIRYATLASDLQYATRTRRNQENEPFVRWLPMSAGHNGGPPLVSMTLKTKVEHVRALLLRSDLTSAQKCVGVALIIEADKEWASEVNTGDLQRMASAKDKETVFRATKALAECGVIRKTSGRGQAGRFSILPLDVVDAIVEAYEDAKSGLDKPDHSKEKWSGETGRHNQSAPTTKPVGLMPTTPKQSASTGPVHADQSSRAEVVNIINNKYNNINNLPISHTEQETAREGETHVGSGVFLNCETIRHKEFSISLKGIELQLLGAVPMDEIKQVALGHALGWALDIEAGKSASKVVPSNTASFIRASIQNQRNNSAVTDVRKARASSKHAPRPDGKTFAQLNEEVMAELERGRRR